MLDPVERRKGHELGRALWRRLDVERDLLRTANGRPKMSIRIVRLVPIVRPPRPPAE
jgi:hypothetical protein